MACKDCIHYGLCPTWNDYNDMEYEEGEWCAEYDKELKDYVYFAEFKDKSKFIELPVSLGDKWYWLRNTSNGWVIRKKKMTLFSISNFFIYQKLNRAFSTRQQAEARLKELNDEQTN